MARVSYVKREEYKVFDKWVVLSKVTRYAERSTDEDEPEDDEYNTLQERIVKQ